MGHFNATAMRFTILLLTCVFWLSSHAQTNVYHPFPITGGEWRVDWGEHSCFSSGFTQASYRYVMNGDTLINGLSYYKIERNYGLPFICGPYYPQGSGFVGAMREDTLARQIYFVPKDSSNEHLIYDFSLSVGDTLPSFIAGVYGLSDLTVSSIDSILIGTDYRKVFNSNSLNSFVEGIGSLAGLLEIQILEITPQLICFTHDSIELYHYFPGIDCDLVTTINDPQFENSIINIFPNPFRTFCTLHVDSKSIFILYNCLGIEVKRIVCFEGSNLFEREELPSGLYFYEVSNAKYRSRGRIVMN